jgi:S-DNA-T family DNA segregation ATPase FtsK/SpoIIIE
MLTDLRARRFRYDRLDVGAVLAALDANTLGLPDKIARFEPVDWSRAVTRLPGEERNARWLVRQVVHEDRHRLADIRGA